MDAKTKEVLEQIERNPKIKEKINLNLTEAAAVIGCSISALSCWKKEGIGPQYIKVPSTRAGANSRVLFPKIAIAEWLAKNTVKTA